MTIILNKYKEKGVLAFLMCHMTCCLIFNKQLVHAAAEQRCLYVLFCLLLFLGLCYFMKNSCIVL